MRPAHRPDELRRGPFRGSDAIHDGLLTAAQLPAGHLLPAATPVVTAPQRTAWEIASERDEIEAVVVLDMVFRSRRPHQESMAAWVAARSRQPRSAGDRARRPPRGVPQETRARLRLHHVGDTDQMARDRLRLNALLSRGWLVLHLTAADLRDPARFAFFCRQLRRALKI